MVFWIEIAAIGMAIGFLAGMFGKGGSAIATPLLAAIGVPPIAAVASPLPATIPSTLAALRAYWHGDFVDRTITTLSLAFGIPATLIGALATRWIGGSTLVLATDIIVAGLGFRFLVRPSGPNEVVRDVDHARLRLVVVATVTGLAAGLLANSGGFLLAPLYLAVLRLPIKRAFASSLAVAAALAVPGTIVHAALGHIDWRIVAVFALTSVPLSFVGARLALRADAEHLERFYGVALAVLGVAFLLVR